MKSFTLYGEYPLIRMRRIRSKPYFRALVAETKIDCNDLILPLFISEGWNQKTQIQAMPDVFRYSLDLLMEEIRIIHSLGIKAIALFPQISSHLKTDDCREAFNPDNLIVKAIKEIKNKFPELLIFADIALDPFNAKGHDGIVKGDEILNDETIEILIKQTLNYVQAGCDVIAPSDMMDGRILKIRRALEQENYHNVVIVSYAAKYASCLYGPFRDAVGSGETLSGDKKSYQMSPHNTAEALQEISLDLNEGADAIIIKPASFYLDIIAKAKQQINAPIFAYQVSGEYSMIKFAAQNKVIAEQQAIFESLIAIKRAGANAILSYFAKDVAIALNS